MEKTAPIHVERVTSSRQDLLNICALLSRGIDDSVLSDKDKPLIVLLNGTLNSGKSLITDGIRMALLSSASKIAFDGFETMNEHWYGRKKGFDFEVTFHNTRGSEKLDNIFAQRAWNMGGIVFLQNTPLAHEAFRDPDVKAGLEIWLESRGHKTSDAEMERQAKDSSLKGEFEKVMNTRWGRYLKVTATDERLCTSTAFKKAMQEINDGAYADGGQFSGWLKMKWNMRELAARNGRESWLNKRHLPKFGVT